MSDSPDTPRWKKLKQKIRELDTNPHALDNPDPEFPCVGRGGLCTGIFPATKSLSLAKDRVVKVTDPEGAESLRREVRLTRKLSHNNIRKSRSSVTTGVKYAYAHFEAAPGVDFITLLMAHKFPPTHDAPTISSDFPAFEGIRHILREIAIGLVHLHRKKIVHNDIKPANIMVDAPDLFSVIPGETKVKIIDLGLGFEFGDAQYCCVSAGDANWASPETWNESVAKTDRKDVFGFGAMVYASFSGHIMCPSDRHKGDITLFREMLGKIHIRMLKSKHTMWAYPTIRELITSCTAYYPESRPSAESLLNTPFFTRRILSLDPIERGEDESD